MLPLRNMEEQAENEPEELRGVTKSILYDQLSATYLLPSKDSKGVNRAYLVGVHTGQNYRVPAITIKRYEADLPGNAYKKTQYVNMNDVAIRLNVLLAEMNQRTLGFPVHVTPEEKWMLRILRYIDQLNILGVFAGPVPNPVMAPCQSLTIYNAKRRAEQFLLGGDLMHNSKIYNQILEIAETKRRMATKQKDVLEMTASITAANLKIQEEQGMLQSAILRGATTILAVGNGLETTDQIFTGEENNQLRLQLQQVIQL